MWTLTFISSFYNDVNRCKNCIVKVDWQLFESSFLAVQIKTHIHKYSLKHYSEFCCSRINTLCKLPFDRDVTNDCDIICIKHATQSPRYNFIKNWYFNAVNVIVYFVS